jgi:hypothetical protein
MEQPSLGTGYELRGEAFLEVGETVAISMPHLEVQGHSKICKFAATEEWLYYFISPNNKLLQQRFQ